MKQQGVDAKGKSYRMLWVELYETNAGEIRKALGIERNYNFNFGTRRKSGKVIPKVRFGSKVPSAAVSTEQEKASRTCVYYNRPGGCNKGDNCEFEHRCWRCFKPGHGACNCWMMDELESKFILRLTRHKNYQVKKDGVFYGWNASQLNAQAHVPVVAQASAPDGYHWQDEELYKKVGGPPPKKKQRNN